MRCPNCENVIPTEVNFCAYCGTPIRAQLVEEKEGGTEIFRLPD